MISISGEYEEEEYKGSKVLVRESCRSLKRQMRKQESAKKMEGG